MTKMHTGCFLDSLEATPDDTFEEVEESVFSIFIWVGKETKRKKAVFNFKNIISNFFYNFIFKHIQRDELKMEIIFAFII